MITDWFSHLPKEKQEEFKNTVLGSKIVLDRLKEICYNRLYALKEKPSEADYDTPSWSFKQAHRNGRIDELSQLIKLLTIKE